MSTPYRVALKGFSAFERSALGSYFRLASNRVPAYEQVHSDEQAHFLLVDADHPDAPRAVLAEGRQADALFIGASAPDGAGAWMMRPIDPLHVLRELDALVGARLVARAPSPGTGSGRVITLIKPVAPGPVPARRAGDGEAAAPAAARRPPSPPPLPRRGNRVLLVETSDSAGASLQQVLGRLPLQLEHVRGSAKAIELLSRRGFDVVFVDIDLGAGSELDGLALCQHIKRQHRHAEGGREPVVALVSLQHSELERVRGTLAGADAYLAPPLDDLALMRLLAQQGVPLVAEAGLPGL